VLASASRTATGTYVVEARDGDGRPLGSTVVEAVYGRDDAGLTLDDVLMRALDGGAESLGVRVGPWVRLVTSDGETVWTAAVERDPLAPIACASWCREGDGHTSVITAADQVCESEHVILNGLDVYLEQPPDGPPSLCVDDDGGHPVTRVPVFVADMLATSLRHLVGLAGGAR